jgi:excisionase family DNA binding protein
MLTLAELCEWFNITEQHARKLVERDAIPYRKVGHLLRFPEAEVEAWSHPSPKSRQRSGVAEARSVPKPRSRSHTITLPKSLIE